jgi:hypothetical protein
LLQSFDKLIVTHIYNEHASVPTIDANQEKLKEKYLEMLTTRLPKDRFQLIWHCHDPKSNLKHELLDICVNNKAYMLGIGYFGCKGTKASDQLSTAVDIASTNNTIPTFVVWK